MTSGSHSNEPHFGPLLYWGIAGGLGWAVHSRLWPMSQQGDGAALIFAVLGGFIVIGMFFKGLQAWDLKAQKRREKKEATTPSDTYGTAKWASKRDLKREGFFRPSGLFLGYWKRKSKLLWSPVQTHSLTLAPSGLGKGTGNVVPSALNWALSCVILDIKAEIYAMTHRYRRDVLGSDIVCLAPFAAKMSRELEIEITDSGWNPYANIDPASDEIHDELMLISASLLPGKANMSASEEFFNRSARNILTFFALYLFSRGVPERVTLPAIRHLAMQPMAKLEQIFMEAAASNAFSRLLAEYGGKLSTTFELAPEEASGGLSTVQGALELYEPHGPMGRHVSKGGFDFTKIKDTPTTVYIIIPGDRIQTHAAWLNMVLNLAIEFTCRIRSNDKVLFLLDEFQNAGYLPNVLSAMAAYRSAGLMVWCIVQQLSALERLYGRTGLADFLGLFECVNAFGIWEPQTITAISNWMGQGTVKDFGQNIREKDHGGNDFDFSYGASNRPKPLMRPEDIRGMRSTEQLIMYRNCPPIRANRLSYLAHREWRRWADPNPYHRKGRRS